ncbi:hypothetical protein B0H17DRAFT_1137728 [Mycena rosella]|uniref:Uncharacterized protein n=1 Tax=Mycena rosella TaxID=1033263 RepID=A0AAD7D814_MYCRO|nr:hypothetical protein B0H17DRAFT_1137728 [Mycena rosella]
MFKARLQALSPPGRAQGLAGRAGPVSGPGRAQGSGFNILKPEPGPQARAWGADQIRTSSPMHRRQTGDLQCNLARLKIISDVAATGALIGELSTATAVAVAQAGLKSIDDGIQTILTAVFSATKFQTGWPQLKWDSA